MGDLSNQRYDEKIENLEARLRRVLEVNQNRVDQLGDIKSLLIELKFDLLLKPGEVDISKRLTDVILKI